MSYLLICPQLEEWWLDRAYHRSRTSLVSTTNFALVWSGNEMPETHHKKTERSRAFTAAVFLREIMRSSLTPSVDVP